MRPCVHREKTPVNNCQPSKMSSIKRQTVKFLSSCFVVFVAQTECVCWQFAPSAAGFTWQRSRLTFSETLIHGIYPFYCQLGSRIHKSMIGYPYLLKDDTVMTDNKGRPCLNGEWECVYGHKEEKKRKDRNLKNDSKRIEAEQKDLSYISLILPQSPGFSCPQRKGFLFHLFIFISVSRRLFIHWLVRLSVCERGAVKSIALTVLT